MHASNKLILGINCCCCQHLNMRTPAVEKMLLMCAFISFQRDHKPQTHWVCFKPLCPKQQSFRYPNLAAVILSKSSLQLSFTYQNLAAVFLFKPCSSLSRIQILQQSFTYPNLAAVFHVSKSCSSLTYPNLAGSSLENIPQVRQITD